ncbi:BamA/TamA family outer membrane protein [Halobacteriovorax sp.]|uniref:BamA/TamA family outer membrane protein n=1 Tax=Halobacteriovorax sp. TaxID=2020862 RepID=UPI003AF2BAE4
MKLQYCIFFLLILNSMTFAQESQRAQKVIEKVSNDSQKGNFVLVPGPSYMPSTKLGLSLIGMYLFDANSGKYKNQDVNVPPSILGAFAKVTTNDSAMGAVGTQLFLGFGAVWNEVIFTSEGSAPLGTSNTGFKFNLFYDTRDNTFSPTDGFYLNTRTSFYRKDLGGDDNITTIDASLSQYFSLSQTMGIYSHGYMTQASILVIRILITIIILVPVAQEDTQVRCLKV